MNKIFEIPIYPFSREELNNRFRNKRNDIINELNIQSMDKDIIDSQVNTSTYPFRMWDYNHIIGFVSISIRGASAFFDVYLPYNRKIYLYTK